MLRRQKQDGTAGTAGTAAGSPPPSEAVTGSQMPGGGKPRVRRRPGHSARLAQAEGEFASGLLHGYPLLPSETR